MGGGGNPALFAGVDGAARCLERANGCDLSRGVIADDAHHRLTINLIAPDPDFLYKLTYFVYPTPPNTSSKQVTIPLPGTGPYRIAAVHHRWNRVTHRTETFYDTLVRNSHFQQWSFAAQPDGYPDVMKWREYPDARVSLAAVSAGTLDIGGRRYGGDTLEFARLVADLQVHHPDRLHTQTLPDTVWESLNTRVPPFDNKLARQAVNYALDRTQLIRDAYGPGFAAPTCQLLPPNFPG